MHLTTVLAIAVSLAMDAFAVSITCGCSNPGLKWSKSLIVAGAFGFFQFLMPIIGWFAGNILSLFMAVVTRWISFGLLGFVGVKMMVESIKSEEGCRDPDDYFNFRILLMLSVATSIDAMAAGLSYSSMGYGIVFPALITGVVTLIISAFGAHAGKRIGLSLGQHAETAGGGVLVLIAVIMLLRNLGVF